MVLHAACPDKLRHAFLGHDQIGGLGFGNDVYVPFFKNFLKVINIEQESFAICLGPIGEIVYHDGDRHIFQSDFRFDVVNGFILFGGLAMREKNLKGNGAVVVKVEVDLFGRVMPGQQEIEAEIKQFRFI